MVVVPAAVHHLELCCAVLSLTEVSVSLLLKLLHCHCLARHVQFDDEREVDYTTLLRIRHCVADFTIGPPPELRYTYQEWQKFYHLTAREAQLRTR